jgi:hypothetical protein
MKINTQYIYIVDILLIIMQKNSLNTLRISRICFQSNDSNRMQHRTNTKSM